MRAQTAKPGVTMKFLSVVLFLLSFNAFANVKVVKLNSVDDVKFSCPEGNELSVRGNTLKCACPEGAIPSFEGKVLKCAATCEITVEPFMEGGGCEQDGSCSSSRQNGSELVVRKNGSGIYYQRLATTKSSEVEFFLPLAIEAARKESCSKTFYSGKEIQ